ncbi:MAG: LysR family transcriptional regulator [Desulfotignum sp.]|nr:LysR family transcriptional regulator [Desulfotignum sp.]MCF8112837.1 LysR family transcriptional regulator [Desulfotignum sp.]MCF8125268.1 LysR family transcriptional regulator [Desulfotignum sp.]
MDLWQLQIFVTVVEQKSFSKASDIINLSQPTVSTHIKELEQHFQCRLLDRLGKKTEPTRAGWILFDHARKILALKDRTESAMLDFIGCTKGRLVIGGSTIPAGYILPRLMGPFAKTYPDVSLHLSTGDTCQVIEDVKHGRVELGVVGARTRDTAIVQEVLLADEMKLIVPGDHKWASLSAVDCLQLTNEPFIARESGSGTWQSICKSMADAGFDARQLNTCVTMGSSVSVIQGILNQVGISILSTAAVADDLAKGRLTALGVNGLNLDRFFYLTLAQKRTQSPICKKFIFFARQHLSQNGSGPA